MKKKPEENQYLYCSNVACPNHSIPEFKNSLRPPKNEHLKTGTRFVKYGKYFARLRMRGKTDGVWRQRYRCVHCRTTFSESICSLDYRNHRQAGFNEKILHLFCEGLSNRRIGASLHVSESFVRDRLRKLGQQSLLMHSYLTRRMKIREPISYDGVENFAVSQYEPNNVNQAIGADSLFTYDFNFAPLNRKGDMSDWQKIKKAKIEKSLGRFPKDAVRTSTANMMIRLLDRCPRGEQLIFLSDEHFYYRQARQRDLPAAMRKRFIHKTISGKAHRVFKHILFPVNHADLLLRQYVKAYSRETISFSKTHGAMMLKYALFSMYKNYMRTRFTKKHARDPKSNIETPAMRVGLVAKKLKFAQLFTMRLLPTHVVMNAEWSTFYKGGVPINRQLNAV